MTAQILTGTYTIVSAKTGDHRTVKIEDDDFAWMTRPPVAGTRKVCAMTGADNERSFTAIGTLSPTGELRIWSKHEHRVDFIAALRFLLKHADNAIEYGKNYATRSGKCFRCNRKLTTPASVFYGYGPECAEIMGLPYDTSAGTTKGAAEAAPTSVPVVHDEYATDCTERGDLRCFGHVGYVACKVCGADAIDGHICDGALVVDPASLTENPATVNRSAVENDVPGSAVGQAQMQMCVYRCVNGQCSHKGETFIDAPADQVRLAVGHAVLTPCCGDYGVFTRYA